MSSRLALLARNWVARGQDGGTEELRLSREVWLSGPSGRAQKGPSAFWNLMGESFWWVLRAWGWGEGLGRGTVGRKAPPHHRDSGTAGPQPRLDLRLSPTEPPGMVGTLPRVG